MQSNYLKSLAGQSFLWGIGLRNAAAALPTPVPPSTNPGTGNWLALIEGYIKDGGLVLGLAIAVIAFLWVSYVAIAKFNEARTGRAEWAEVGLTGIVAAGVLVFIGFLINEAANVIP
jgi:integrating conjugative element membrane protein (TIGR03745 family)